eukprot:5393986-Pyramimonas_sp.AAC.1
MPGPSKTRARGAREVRPRKHREQARGPYVVHIRGDYCHPCAERPLGDGHHPKCGGMGSWRTEEL